MTSIERLMVENEILRRQNAKLKAALAQLSGDQPISFNGQLAPQSDVRRSFAAHVLGAVQ